MGVKIMETMEGEEIMERTEEEGKSRDTHESMAQGEIPTKVKITWMIIALLKSMELLHPSMELLHPSMELLHPNMDTALEGGMVETEATNLPLREVTIRPLGEVTIPPLKEVTIPPPGEVTIQPPYAAITRQRRSHNEVMERTEATRQRGV